MQTPDTTPDTTTEAEEEESVWRTIPNRRDLRAAGLTLPRRRSGHFRRQVIKRMRAGYEVLA